MYVEKSEWGKMFHRGNAVEEVGCHESEFDDRYKGLGQ